MIRSRHILGIMELYYNTTELDGEILKAHRIRAGSSSAHCLRIMMQEWEFTPWLAHAALKAENGGRERFPITSIRRAFNTLENRGCIRNTGRRRYVAHTDAYEFIYQLNPRK